MNNSQPTFEELEIAALPLVNILYKYYNSHTTILINQTSVEILCGEMTMSIEPKD